MIKVEIYYKPQVIKILNLIIQDYGNFRNINEFGLFGIFETVQEEIQNVIKTGEIFNKK